jgi:hypothetical protein
VTLKVMRSKLSEKFGVTERSNNRILKGLKEEKVLDITNNSIVIKDLHKLQYEINILKN